ncbi:MAG: SDR family NAD(P)-dependent oxidoreductase [Streptosporangiales bacterium]|nr:SDR family NAD(P)-dependent oxidoreductase [Streptosporangiales bacterium]
MAAGAFEGKVALVTGGAGGIGSAVARRLAGGGARVVVADLNESGAAAVAAEVGGAYLGADLGRPESSERAVALAEERYGRLDLVHLNAGAVTGVAELTELDPERYRSVVGVNLDAVVYGARAALPALRRAAGGAILATASLAGLVAYPDDPIYATTKHAVVGLVRSLAARLTDEGIRVSAICPGFADTAMLAPHRDMLVSADFPLLTADDVAEAVERAFLDPETGQLWVVQPGREPVPYRFSGVPGPRTPGAEGKPPPVLRSSRSQR